MHLLALLSKLVQTMYDKSMSGQYDKIIKETMRDVVDVLLSKVMKIDAVSVTVIESKMQVTDEREADFLLKVVTVQGDTIIVHIEFQLTNDTDMVYRMLRYWCHMTQIHKLPVIQYVFYIGNKPLTMANSIAEPRVKYQYELIDMRTIDCEKFLYSEKPQEMIISILCNLQTKGAKVYMKELLQRIKDFVSEETLRSKYIKQIEVISLTRDLQDYICKEVENMALTYDIEKDVRFKQGLSQGLSQGLEKGLLEGIELALEIKFGSTGLALMEKIGKIDNLDTLKKIKGYIREVSSIDELVRLLN
ncbi:Transposase (putative), YhgA-like protein [Candidatus Magnetobacterium bavaricum]|uniref:Transposase (Putative), YhgA-like protein n=1 Tax=Candidatus Magnetobacterium bavaricum TaxID=29290 RepID=A0A0F3GXR4_9BACT|nr:Transposase (putative), YhgA-like protein [Candidatus Magnetobacterium bavaricum]